MNFYYPQISLPYKTCVDADEHGKTRKKQLKIRARSVSVNPRPIFEKVFITRVADSSFGFQMKTAFASEIKVS